MVMCVWYTHHILVQQEHKYNDLPTFHHNVLYSTQSLVLPSKHRVCGVTLSTPVLHAHSAVSLMFALLMLFFIRLKLRIFC